MRPSIVLGALLGLASLGLAAPSPYRVVKRIPLPSPVSTTTEELRAIC